jgi:acetyl-CoA acyltransferase 2
MLRKAIFVVAAKRTPFGAYGGKLTSKTCTDLGEIAAKAALQSGNINPEHVGTCIYGNVVQSNRDTPYLARHVALRCGVPQDVPCHSVNRLCGSSFQSIISGAHELQLDEAEIALTGGSENMSEAPFAVWNVRFGTRFGVDYKFEDVLWSTLTDAHIKLPMAITAENLAEKYKISRQECDEFALLSQKRWQAAHDSGIFQDELVGVPIKGKKGPEEFIKDEHPRGNGVTLEALGKLPAVFKKDGVVTAGNASGVCDGGATVILATEDAVKKYSLKPLARLSGYGVSGCDPRIMGIGPVPAIQKLLNKAKLTIEDIDLWEVNEAFAAQCIAVQRELKLPQERLNVHGGAIAIGHPVGTSGARISGHLAHLLASGRVLDSVGKPLKRVIGSACIGGGQGIAVLLEKI